MQRVSGIPGPLNVVDTIAFDFSPAAGYTSCISAHNSRAKIIPVWSRHAAHIPTRYRDIFQTASGRATCRRRWRRRRTPSRRYNGIQEADQVRRLVKSRRWNCARAPGRSWSSCAPWSSTCGCSSSITRTCWPTYRRGSHCRGRGSPRGASCTRVLRIDRGSRRHPRTAEPIWRNRSLSRPETRAGRPREVRRSTRRSSNRVWCRAGNYQPPW